MPVTDNDQPFFFMMVTSDNPVVRAVENNSPMLRNEESLTRYAGDGKPRSTLLKTIAKTPNKEKSMNRISTPFLLRVNSSSFVGQFICKSRRQQPHDSSCAPKTERLLASLRSSAVPTFTMQPS